MKNTFLISLLLISSLIAQPQRREVLPVFKQPFQSEIISIPSGSDSINFFYTYKIPYSQLVFEKDNSIYSAGLRVLLEITNADSDLIAREIKDTEVAVEDFEATNERAIFLEDYLNLKILPGSYSVSASIIDINSQNEKKLEPQTFEWNSENSNNVIHPLVIETVENECGADRIYKLANFGGTVPFSPSDYHLVIPLVDTTIEKIKIKIINNDETIFDREISEAYLLPVGIAKCMDNLVFQRDDNSILTKNFILRNVNKNLNEGNIKLIVNLNDEKSKEFISEVVWIDKPFSLRNPEMAIELLSFIEPDSVISRLLETDDSEYYQALNSYWASFDPTPETSYNQLMTEYYRRLDYAAREFRGLGKDNGIKTDRGMIYIRFGKPLMIERSSNAQGQVIETWTYEKPKRKFIFVDKRGTGNFTLIES